MADNVAVTAGSGTNIATDDVSGVHYQKVKLDVGADGVSAPAKSTADVEGNTALTTTGMMATAIGPGWDRRLNPSNLGTVVSNTSAWDVNGCDVWTVQVGTSTTGTFTIEMTADGTNWVAGEVKDGVSDTTVSGQNLTPTAGRVYRLLTSGYRQARLRTVTTLGATMAHVLTGVLGTSMISTLDMGPAPHTFGYTVVHKDVEYTSAQTGTAVWTPASGKKFVVTDVTVATGGTTAAVLTLWQGASADTTYNAGTDPAIFRGEFAPSATVRPGMVKSYRSPYVSTTADHILRITTSAGLTCYVQVEGYEI